MLAPKSLRGCLSVLMIVLVASCGGNPSGGAPLDSAVGEHFADLLQTGVGVDYDVVGSPSALRDAADLVLIGTISNIVRGRDLPYGRATAQANLVVEVERIIKGLTPNPETVFVEVPLPSGMLVSELASGAPDGRVVLFLGDRTYLKGIRGEAGRPDGSAIYAPFTQGMIIEAGSAWVSGLVNRDEMPRDWQTLETFDLLLASIET